MIILGACGDIFLTIEYRVHCSSDTSNGTLKGLAIQEKVQLHMVITNTLDGKGEGVRKGGEGRGGRGDVGIREGKK